MKKDELGIICTTSIHFPCAILSLPLQRALLSVTTPGLGFRAARLDRSLPTFQACFLLRRNALKMEAASTSQTSVNIYQTTRCKTHLHIRHHENLKSHTDPSCLRRRQRRRSHPTSRYRRTGPTDAKRLESRRRKRPKDFR
jgi:hypothetical protein